MHILAVKMQEHASQLIGATDTFLTTGDLAEVRRLGRYIPKKLDMYYDAVEYDAQDESDSIG